MGIPVEKCPLDLWLYQELIFRTRPEIVVECGVFRGGGTLYFATIVDILEKGKVVGIDLDLKDVDARVRNDPRVTLIEGNSIDLAVVDKVRARTKGLRTMVVLDSDHAFEHVQRELDLYADLVSPGCYLVVEDTNINGHPVAPNCGPGPYEAVAQFLRKRPDFKLDRDQHRYLMTFNPNGYLKRL